MSNLSKLIRYESLSTTHLQVVYDVNTGGYTYYPVPLVASFAERDFAFDDVSIRLFVLIDDSSEYVNYSTNKIIAGWSSNKCELLVDDIYVFLTGDKMFFDGQTMPIVSVEKDGVFLYPFEQGKENYLNHIRDDMRLGPFDL